MSIVGPTKESLECSKMNASTGVRVTGKRQTSRQKRSDKMRKNAGLTQVKVYLDETTLQLLGLLQENMSEGDMKGDEVNMFRSMAITASIHTLAKERLGEQEVSHMVIKNLGADCPSDEATENPRKFLLRTMINHLYDNGTHNPHRRRLSEVAGIMNESSFRNPKNKKGGWSENDISHYVSNDIKLENDTSVDVPG
ncbi:TPA: hypothetical protein ACG1RV_003118 [Salmonella enterica subsp. enterica serovar Derby]|uniref:hypothetical protein n=1 Tax=Enterobacteriaceae TaxID=543 RepID=UPI001CCD4E4A|nr:MULTISPECIES: hypothetical protein [Enterobacteriaceae]MCL8988297.1 hypothetical protein [Salmonella enterica subsp. enterica serovar Enteritidis]MDJ6204996.1 hypothetical protein [Salmonella enterica]MCA7277091.1 hypothetical protein [Escherichia coli]MCA7695383.1 hypothetical protein [Escherichia coli]MCA7756650.1 hypothetical protein [Escherichia coli]